MLAVDCRAAIPRRWFDTGHSISARHSSAVFTTLNLQKGIISVPQPKRSCLHAVLDVQNEIEQLRRIEGRGVTGGDRRGSERAGVDDRPGVGA